ncbi:MAG: CapA family protein, partial [Parcubacteria group bacterium]|nr:CapA family protein [Parcubacteria group bacterium]
AYNLTWNPPSEEEIAEQVRELKTNSDFVIVSFHWGEEYQDFPSEKQRSLAHKIIDAGANIVMGHHGHHLQPVEKYKNGLILYSLGNLIFDQMWSEKTRLGALVKVSWYENGNLDYEILPTKIFDFAQPRFLTE